mmetsp:Transcript_17253/g.36398  ORF Transcript_17253/g.36398 Transcript_17253/m.36398 type:complete len:313 (-) Transcript_17253:433-1371(-)
MDGISASEHTRFLLGGGTIEVRTRRRRRDVGVNLILLVRGGDCGDEGVFRGKGNVCDSENGVGTCGEDCNFLILQSIHGKLNLRPGALSNPLFLRSHRPTRPIQSVQSGLQSIGIFGNLKHPLSQRQTLHGMISTFAKAIDHLLVREHGSECRTPIHRYRTLLCQSPLIKLEENPLRPLDILDVSGGHLLLPIVGKSEHLQLAFEVGNVLSRRDLGTRSGVNGELFGGQTERVPSNGMKDVVGGHAPVTGHDVGGGVSLGMSHVQTRARGVGEHIENVLLFVLTFDDGAVFLGGASFGRGEGLVFHPVRLPL